MEVAGAAPEGLPRTPNAAVDERAEKADALPMIRHACRAQRERAVAARLRRDAGAGGGRLVVMVCMRCMYVLCCSFS